MAEQKKASKGDKKAAKANGKHRFHGVAFGKHINASKGHRHCTPLARYLRTGIKDHACTGM